MKKLLSLSLLFGFSFLNAQNIGIGTWRSHQSYYQAQKLVQANNTVFCSTLNGLFSVNLEDHSITKFTREKGLGSAGISALHFSVDRQIIIIGYSDGIIDLLGSDGKIVTLKTLRNAPIVADKRIHDISSQGNSAYLATDFGVVVLDLLNKVVKENYRNIGPDGNQVSVTDLLIASDSLFISTDLGIQSGSFNNNLLDFNEWEFYEETNSDFDLLTKWEGKIYAIRNGTELWELGSDLWVNTGITFPEIIQDLLSSDELYALTENSILSVFPSPVVLLSPEELTKGNQLRQVNGDFWVADETSGLLKLSTSAEQVIPSGPRNDRPSKLKWINGVIYALFGPSAENYIGSSDGLGYSHFENGQWRYLEIPEFFNISDVSAIDQKLYFTSMGFGLYDHDLNVILNHQNSAFAQSNSFETVQLSAIQAFENSLFITAYNSNQPLYELTETEILPFSSVQLNSQFPRNLDISHAGILWVERGTSDGGGIATFDPTSLEARLFRISDGLPSSMVSGISIDHGDEAWIATSNGPASYSSASFPFNEFGVTTPIFETGFLFQGEPINDILTDGGDRIWFATNQGLWVLSPDLSEVVYRFDVDNSPLLSNKVLKFSYDQTTGEVFILTDKGLISFRSDSSFGEITSSNNIKIFPNPVLSTFSGKVGITGLVRNAEVKITDTKGRLVASLKANGGTAEWTVTNYLGDRVDTGIYLVFSSNEDGTETAVGKIAVIK